MLLLLHASLGLNYFFTQAICCQNFVHKMPMTFSYVHLCNICKFQRGVFKNMPHQNQDLCAICGAWVPSNMRTNTKEAIFCREHMTKIVPPNWGKCFSCRRMQPEKDFVKMSLCVACSMGRGINKCCHLAIEDDD